MSHAMEVVPTNVKVSRFDKNTDIAEISTWTQVFCSQVLNAVKSFSAIPILNAVPFCYLTKYLGVPYGVANGSVDRISKFLSSDEAWKVSKETVIQAATADHASIISSVRGSVTAIRFSNGFHWVFGPTGFRESGYGGVWVFSPRAVAKIAVDLIAVTQVGVEVRDMIAEHRRYEQIIRQGLYDPLSKQYLSARAKGYINSIARLEVSPIHIPTESLLTQQVIQLTRPSMPN